jgi:antitoxin FitA
MSKTIQLRNVPDALHRKLKTRAARKGMSLSKYLVLEIRKIAERSTLEELWERMQHRSSFHLTESSEDSVRAERDSD